MSLENAADPTRGPGLYRYVGELLDPEQAPLTQSVYACMQCGVLVVGDTQHVHEASHAANRERHFDGTSDSDEAPQPRKTYIARGPVLPLPNRPGEEF